MPNTTPALLSGPHSGILLLLLVALAVLAFGYRLAATALEPHTDTDPACLFFRGDTPARMRGRGCRSCVPGNRTAS